MVCLNSALYNVSGTGLGLRQDKWRIVCANNKERFLRHLQIFINHLLRPRHCLSPWYTLANKQTKSFCFCEVYIQGRHTENRIYAKWSNKWETHKCYKGNKIDQGQGGWECHGLGVILTGLSREIPEVPFEQRLVGVWTLWVTVGRTFQTEQPAQKPYASAWRKSRLQDKQEGEEVRGRRQRGEGGRLCVLMV